MRFTVKGKFDGRPVELAWEDGQLTGDPEAVERIRYRAFLMRGEPIRLGTGPVSRGDHLHQPEAALDLIVRALTEVEVNGFTFAEDAPPDAVF